MGVPRAVGCPRPAGSRDPRRRGCCAPPASGLTAASTGDELLGSRTAGPTLSEGPEPMFTGTTVPETVRQLGDETPLTTYAVLASGFIARATGVGGIAGERLWSRRRVATS